MAEKSSLFGNTCLLGAASLFSKLLSFFTLPFFTAWLSPEAFGTVDILLTTALLLLPLVTLNASEAAFRFLAAGEGTGAVLFGAFCLLALGTGVLLLLLPLLSHLSFLRGNLLYLFVYIAASAARSFAVHILRARGRYTAVAIGQALCALLTVLLQILLIYYKGLGAAGYLLGVALGDFLTALLLAFLVLGGARGGKLTKSSALFRKMLRYALPLVPTAALWWGSAVIDRYLLHHYHGAAAVGLYAVAAKIPALLTFGAGVFMEAWHYSVASTGAGERAKLFGRTYSLLLPFGVLAASGLILLGKPLFGLLFAASYAEAVHALPYLILSALFAALSQFLGSAYVAGYRSGAALVTAAIGVLVNLLLNLLLIPVYGTIGAALATLISYQVLFLIRLAHVKRSMPLPSHLAELCLAALLLLSAAAFYAKAPVLSLLFALSAPLPLARLLCYGVGFLWRRAKFFLFSFKKGNNM